MYKIKKETLEKTLNYLAFRPFSEVAQLITELQTAEFIKDKKEKKDE